MAMNSAFLRSFRNNSVYRASTQSVPSVWKTVNPQIIVKPKAEPIPKQLQGFSAFDKAKHIPTNAIAIKSSLSSVTQVRYAHTDVKIPSFDEYRTINNRDPQQMTNHGTIMHKTLYGYALCAACGSVGLVGAKSIIHFGVGLWMPSADSVAAAKMEMDISGIPLGKNITVKWAGKPLFIRHRTPEEIDKVRAESISILRDKQLDEDRVIKPEWLVCLAICTHLGCVPIPYSGDWGGYFCPCHGSHYDASGRVRKGPAPTNLEVPPYEFIDDNTIVIGKDF